MKYFLTFTVWAFLFSCSQTAATANSPTVKKNGDTNANEGSLTLSWKVLPEMSSYHIFYVNAKKAVREIDSVSKDDEAFAAGKIIVDSSNMETWPKSGEKACFYVVADLEGVKSDPSNQACLNL